MKGVVLRGHHLLCVHGFQGMGYSPQFVQRMAKIVERFRDPEQDFPVKVVRGFDDACWACPNKGPEKCEASPDSEAHVLTLDQNVIRHLGLKEEGTYMKSDLLTKTRERVRPEDLNHLCRGCSWLPMGVCRDGIARLRSGTP